jgi:ferredoxin-NADP reductase
MEYSTEFIERLERTPASISYRFKRPTGFSFRAGQYMLVNLGEKRVHPLSLSDCPEENGFIEFTKRMTGSPFCQRLEALNKGETVIVKGPVGKFYPDDAGTTLVMIAGGIGITPIRSILKSLEKKRGEHSKIILLYGNLNREDIAFRDELENLKIPDYRLVHVLSDTSGMENARQGFITAEIVAKEVPEDANAFYMISGPPVMVEAMQKELAKIRIPAERIRTDMFFGYE